MSKGTANQYLPPVADKNTVNAERRWRYRTFVAMAALSIFALSGFCRADSQPNVVIILADDLGWRDVGYHGSEIMTPRIDTLAASGVVLERFYTQPSCSPARAALMTGESSLRLGILPPLAKIDPAGLPLNRRLLPAYLRDHGYQTYMVGKWHLGYRQQAYHPTSRGFDHFYGNVTGGIGYWDHVHGGGLDWQRDGETLREPGYSTHLTAAEAVRIIETRDPLKPLFLYAAFNAPHLPNEAPADTVARYADLEAPRRLHAAMVTELDTAVGQVIDALMAANLLDNTLVWFISDNGGLNSSAFSDGTRRFAEWLDSWFADDEVPIRLLEFLRVNVLQGGADNRPFRGGKQTVYEGGVRVPSLVFWPGRLPPMKSEQMITIQDVLPTLLAATGTDDGDQRFDGANQWQFIQGQEQSHKPDFVTHGADGEALYRFPWKLIRLSSGELALYNLESDPTEMSDLSASEPSLVMALEDALLAAPRGPSVQLPIYRSIFNMDFFGGEETNPPWAEQQE